MAAIARAISQTIRDFWIAVTTESAKPLRVKAVPDVMIYDPAAKQAHDLDDPFFDDDVQARAADVIAASGHKH